MAAARTDAEQLALWRSDFAAALRGLGLDVVDGQAPFVLFSARDAVLVRKRLRTKDIAVRRCDTFIGLGDDHLRVAVRQEWPILVEALREVLV